MDKQLQVVKYAEQRVVTTQQIAEVYGTTTRRVSENYNANKDRYIEGKHFYCLEGEALEIFKATSLEFRESSTEIPYSLKGINKLYLWTKHGAFLHAKSLNTDKAWEAYNQLVDSYFLQLDQIAMLQQQLAELERRLSLLDLKPRQNRLPGMRQIALPERGFCITNDRYSITSVQEKELAFEYVQRYWDTYREAVTSSKLKGVYFKGRFSTRRLQSVLEGLAQDGKIEQIFTSRTRFRGKFRPLPENRRKVRSA